MCGRSPTGFGWRAAPGHLHDPEHAAFHCAHVFQRAEPSLDLPVPFAVERTLGNDGESTAPRRRRCRTRRVLPSASMDFRTPSILPSLVMGNDARLLAHIATVLARRGAYLPLIDGPRIHRCVSNSQFSRCIQA